MRVVDVWEALGHNDRDEGRQGMHRIGVFTTEAAALGVAAQQGVFGGDGEVKKRRAVIVDIGPLDERGTFVLEDAPVVVHEGDPNLLREQALSKAKALLTPQERAALGLP